MTNEPLRTERLTEISADAAKHRQRIEANQAYGRDDLGQIILRSLDLREGEAVLDIGCGTGIHLLGFLERVGPGGKVVGLDVDQRALDDVRERAAGRQPVPELVQGAMEDLERLVSWRPFDAACCAYALYYAQDPVTVIEQVARVLSPRGRFAVAGPYAGNNGEFLSLLGEAGLPARPALDPGFMDRIVEPVFQRLFGEVSGVPYENLVTYPTPESVVGYWRSTAYYVADAEEAFAQAVQRHFAAQGEFTNGKRGLVLQGRDPRS